MSWRRKMNIEDIEDIVSSLSNRYYKDNSLYLGKFKLEDDGTYLICVKFKESFIPRLSEREFSLFKRDLYTKITKLFEKQGIRCRKICSGGGCGSCGSHTELPYRLQFEEDDN
jgi:hypothetical protein